MKVTIENYQAILPAKQMKLIKAIARVHVLIKKYSKDLPNWESKHKWDFNLLHDLEYRLEDKAKEVWSLYGDFNWEKNGINVY